jgi:hypothetical protein
MFNDYLICTGDEMVGLIVVGEGTNFEGGGRCLLEGIAPHFVWGD